MIERAKLPLLDRRAIEEILEARFSHERFTRLRDLPPPEALAGIPQACELIIQAMREKKRLVIIGDYDVDGVVSSAILAEFFERLGCPIAVIIPNRFCDGYGLSPHLVRHIEADLIITVDNGISAHEAAEICHERGITLIITDHHTPPATLPNADVIINPKLPHCPFPQKEICGANVAWYLCAALKNRLGVALDMGESLDLLALAIIADVMPLVGINRLLVRQGLRQMARSTRPAMVALRQRFRKDSWVSEDVAFLIAPLLNSAGRMDDARVALEFLRSDSLAKAHEGLEELMGLNQERKEAESQLFEAALEQIDPQSRALVVHGEGWHEGVLGIVASRLCERFGKPSFVLSQKGAILKGSARSVGGIDLVPLLVAQHERLIGYGGHKAAAGLKLEARYLEAFKEALEASLEGVEAVGASEGERYLGEIALESIDGDLLGILERFEPYGEGNPKPRFFCARATIGQGRIVGAERNHTALTLQEGALECKAVAFRQVYELERGASVACFFSIARDSFYQKPTPQLIIEKLERL